VALVTAPIYKMRLYTKLTLYNALSKILIVVAFVMLVPSVIERLANNHTDTQLVNMKSKTLAIVNRLGVKEFIEEEHDSVFASYNILKEEFISIEPLQGTQHPGEVIENTQRSIESEIVDFRVLSYTFKSGDQFYLLEVGKSLNRIEVLQDFFKKLAFNVLLIALLITVMIDVMFTRFLLRPFQLIENKLKKTNHPESFDFAMTKTNTTDFRYLDESINEMMHKINDAFAHERLFIANVSHELLTPISIIKNRLENILADEKLPEEAAMRIIETKNTLNRLIKIVNALLLISRIDNQQFLKEDEVNLNELVKEVIAEIEDRAVEKNISLKTDLNYAESITNVNKYLLFTMLFNLVNNAIKYNATNGSVTIATYSEHNIIKIDVKDTGKGIPPENIDSLFGPFKKIKKDKLDSHGLGLPIVKTIADFHGIHIQVSSKIGEGSIFVLSFPEK
jgi:signal transduction histidine kinase